MPTHLRWEIYPVPHEINHHYGGSYYEEVNWWEKPRKTTTLGMLKELLTEMLFEKRAYLYNRRMWYFSFPFHSGIYLILLWFLMLIVGGLYVLAGGVLTLSSPIYSFIYYITLIAGGLGIILATIGSLSLLLLRISDNKLRKYSTGVDYLNEVIILLVLISGIIVWLGYDIDFSTARLFTASLLSFGALNPPTIYPATTIHIILLGILFMYIPFTKMTHFIGKYFTYHTILWDDAPVIGNEELAGRLRKYLEYKVKWSAPHIDKGKTWKELASKPNNNVKKVWGVEDE
jgi:nitrate reductase gamma subunit